MKFLSASLLLSALVGTNAAETDNNSMYKKGYSGEIINEHVHDGSVFNENVTYEGTCEDQSHCLGLTVHEVQRRCGSGSCEYYVCYYTEVGHVSVDVFVTTYLYNGYNRGSWDDTKAAEATLDECKQHPEFGVDYAGNINTLSPDEDTGGCLNTANSKGKGLWDETCINPELADASTGITTTLKKNRFSDFCQVVAPGHTVHFMMHSYNRLDWNGLNPAPVTCSGSAEVLVTGEADKFGSSRCAPSSQNGPYGQTYFPATDGSSGGTCSDEPEGEECVWSYTAPNECRYEENDPICHITQASVDTVTSLCPGNSVVEYYDHANNPNEAPPRVPLHNIVHNGDGTVSFSIYNPYGNYNEPIVYDGTPCGADCDLLYGPGGAYDFHDLYVVYDQANGIGNEVCDVETAAGKCASDNTYTAYCRSDGVAVVTVFASGKDATSAAAQQITNGEGTDVFECCPTSHDPNFTKASTAAWTFLVHCGCPEDNNLDRRQLSKEEISAKFQRGELFNENQKKLHGLL